MSGVKTVLVTGGCGFIGSHFIHLLLRRTPYQVVNLDKLTYAGDLTRLADVNGLDRYTNVKGDVVDSGTVQDLMAGTQPWAVVNFAAESHVDRSILDPAPFLHTNVIGVQVLLEAARRHGVERFLQISTDEVYGDVNARPPSCEDSPPRPSNPYSASKAAADLFSLSYHRTHGLPVIIARSSNNYGPFQFPEKLIPLTILNALSGKELPVYGDGLQQRDWLHANDNCEAILKVLEHGAVGAIYNIGTGQERTNLSVVEAVCDLVARLTQRDPAALRARIKFVADRPGHDRRYSMDAGRSRSELGWSPQVAFSAGLESTIAWYVQNAAWVAKVAGPEFQAYYDAVYRQAWGRPS
jgi:dTDP-glucose 4,6-dehydratase